MQFHVGVAEECVSLSFEQHMRTITYSSELKRESDCMARAIIFHSQCPVGIFNAGTIASLFAYAHDGDSHYPFSRKM